VATRDEHVELLTTISWDIRKSAEAQLVALTSLQRCLDEYREHHDYDTLREMMMHLSTVDQRVLEVQNAMAVAVTTVTTLQATHT
jgi:hypothetical protein